VSGGDQVPNKALLPTFGADVVFRVFMSFSPPLRSAEFDRSAQSFDAAHKCPHFRVTFAPVNGKFSRANPGPRLGGVFRRSLRGGVHRLHNP
jgi:hypothetical protein